MKVREKSVLAICIAIVVLFAALLIVLMSLKPRRETLMDTTAVTLLRMLLRKHGLDPERVPNPVLTKIVINKVEALQTSATMHMTSSRDLQYDLFVLLDAEADLIGRILRDGPDRFTNSSTTRLLVEHGIVQHREPVGMSAREFLKAVETNTLFKELDLRVASRAEKQQS